MEIHVAQSVFGSVTVQARGGNEQGAMPGLRRSDIGGDLGDQAACPCIPANAVEGAGNALIGQVAMAGQ
jgi:hypothetical protein